MTNYTIIQNTDITNLSLSDGAYRCYNLLLSMCYADKNTCYPSIKYIATALGRSCRTINRYIKELIKLGYISKRRRGSISNVYTLLQKKVQQTVQNIKDKVKNRESGYKKNTSDKQSLSNTNSKKNNYNNKPKKDKFNDFEQRDYNFDKLEKLLLEGKGNLSDCQITPSAR
ncbi:transcriptional regulator [Clostridium tepidum]|uniref:Transcriptional regulator n=1 Tax=Clostridium tepidum TaxID=1962263 RepID=A0A1S9I1S2_9CLOT|nr:helix-turn-helix domain-containing protein [Clostridium tepidum]OOO64291.1 transcriptional regulator [Clostridium tepidum]